MSTDATRRGSTPTTPSATIDTKPRKLGRGLSSLLSTPVAVPQPATITTQVSVHKQTQSPAIPPSSSASTPAQARDGLVMLAVADIGPSPLQPRRTFDEAALDRLAESIRRSGVMQPIIVRPGSTGPRFELVAGERRWRAATRAGLTQIPAIVRALTDEETAEWALVENVQREDLNPIERAEAFAQLTRRFGLSQADVAARVGLDRTSVANLVRLLELEPQIREKIAAGVLTFGHGRALLAMSPGPARITLAQRAIDEQWSVRQLERTVAATQAPAVTAITPKKPDDLARVAARAALEKQLGEHLGTKVHITTDRGGAKGRLTIEFFGLDHFDGLLHKFGFTPK